MNSVKHIIFDLGGVILNIDYHKPQAAFAALGVTNIEALYTKQAQSELFDLLETGKISRSDFLNGIKKLAGKPELTDEAVEKSWNSILLDFPLRRLQLLQQLQLHYDTFLLSNTNIIHEEAFNHLLFQTCGFPNIGVLFHKAYLSHHVGLRKPDPAIFELVLAENNLKPEETLFIDDSEQHITSAKKLGLQTIHITGDLSIEKIFMPKF